MGVKPPVEIKKEVVKEEIDEIPFLNNMAAY